MYLSILLIEVETVNFNIKATVTQLVLLKVMKHYSPYVGIYDKSLHCQGMVEPGDTVSATLKKEFGEEAMNSLEASPEEKKKIEGQVNQLFSQGEEVKSYCMLTLYSQTLNVNVLVKYLYCT